MHLTGRYATIVLNRAPCTQRGAFFMRGRVITVTVSEMLQVLSGIWRSTVTHYPEAEHEEILIHIEALQSLLFHVK